MWQAVRPVGLALLLGLIASCSGKVNPAEFNDKIAQSNKRIAKEAWAFREVVFPLNNREEVDEERVENAHKDLVKLIKDIKEERKQTKLPSFSTAEELHKAYDIFLDSQQRLLDQEFERIKKIAFNRALPPDVRWTKIDEVLAVVREKESQDFTKLQEAQSRFASEVGMKLVHK